MAGGQGFGPAGDEELEKKQLWFGQRKLKLAIDESNLASWVVQNRRRSVQGYVKVVRKLFASVRGEQWDVFDRHNITNHFLE